MMLPQKDVAMWWLDLLRVFPEKKCWWGEVKNVGLLQLQSSCWPVAITSILTYPNQLVPNLGWLSRCRPWANAHDQRLACVKLEIPCNCNVYWENVVLIFSFHGISQFPVYIDLFLPASADGCAHRCGDPTCLRSQMGRVTIKIVVIEWSFTNHDGDMMGIYLWYIAESWFMWTSPTLRCACAMPSHSASSSMLAHLSRFPSCPFFIWQADAVGPAPCYYWVYVAMDQYL